MSARSRLAVALVRWASRSMEAGYDAYVRVDRDGFPAWWEKPWHAYARRVCRIAIPCARRLDAEATTTQMIEEAWWG